VLILLTETKIETKQLGKTEEKGNDDTITLTKMATETKMYPKTKITL
jgi:hypothetical protein